VNLFILDEDHDKNAKYHNNAHVGKMILETAQLLCTTLWVDIALGRSAACKLEKKDLDAVKKYVQPFRELNQQDRPVAYLPVSHNHPCATWVRSSIENYYWTYCYAHSLSIEFLSRRLNTHKSMDVINNLPEPKYLPSVKMTPFAQAMPEQYNNDNAVVAYRNYYLGEKQHLATWSPQTKPGWYK